MTIYFCENCGEEIFKGKSLCDECINEGYGLVERDRKILVKNPKAKRYSNEEYKGIKKTHKRKRRSDKYVDFRVSEAIS